MINKKKSLPRDLDQEFAEMMQMIENDDVDLNFHTYVANWKMELTYEEAIDWIIKHGDELAEITEDTDDTIVICPSYTSLYPIANHIMDSTLSLGAQNCADQERGPYTGEESVLTLKDLGCNYCIVGHSERRMYFGETDQMISNKVQLLLKNEIQPILCIGETIEENLAGKTKEILKHQIDSVFANIKETEFELMAIAYEPVWAIGTKIPKISELEDTLDWIREYTTAIRPQLFVDIFYGGSINDKNISELKSMWVDGFLIGKSSTNFDMFKNIILAE